MNTNAAERQEKLECAARLILEVAGENLEREGLLETPRRFARAWLEFFDYEPGKTDTCFQAIQSDSLVVVTGVKVWSFCEHHLLPFWCELTIGYLAKEHVLGLSKLARIAHKCAHKLQIQERLVEEIAREVNAAAGAQGDVAVIGTGEHLCVTMRGARTDLKMVTSALQGDFRNLPALRAEFLMLAANGKAK